MSEIGSNRYGANTQVTIPNTASANPAEVKALSAWDGVDSAPDDNTLNQDEVRALVAELLGDDENVDNVMEEIVEYLNEHTDYADVHGGNASVDNFTIPDYLLADMLDLDSDGDIDQEDATVMNSADVDGTAGNKNIFLQHGTGFTSVAEDAPQTTEAASGAPEGSATGFAIDIDQDGTVDAMGTDDAAIEVEGWFINDPQSPDNGSLNSQSVLSGRTIIEDETKTDPERMAEVHKIMYALVMIGVSDDGLEGFYNSIVNEDGSFKPQAELTTALDNLKNALDNGEHASHATRRDQQAINVSNLYSQGSHVNAEHIGMADNVETMRLAEGTPPAANTPEATPATTGVEEETPATTETPTPSATPEATPATTGVEEETPAAADAQTPATTETPAPSATPATTAATPAPKGPTAVPDAVEGSAKTAAPAAAPATGLSGSELDTSGFAPAPSGGTQADTTAPAASSSPVPRTARSADAEENFGILEQAFQNGEVAVTDIQAFLEGVQEGAEGEAIADLLYLFGVRGPDGKQLSAESDLILNLQSEFDGDPKQLTELATYLNGAEGAEGNVSLTDAMSTIMNRIYRDDSIDATEIQVLADLDGDGEPGTAVSADIYTKEGFAAQVMGDGAEMSDIPTVDEAPKLASALSVLGGVSGADAHLIAHQMINDGMTMSQIFATMDGGRINGSSSEKTNLIDYGDGSGGKNASNGFASPAEAKWGLADYVESRAKSETAVIGLDAISIDAPAATYVSDADQALGVGGVTLQTNASIPVGAGQEVLSDDMQLAYDTMVSADGTVNPEELNYENLNALWETAGGYEAQQRTVLSLILDMLDLDKEDGMPLDAHDPLVTALLDKGGEDGNFGDILTFMMYGDTPPANADAATYDYDVTAMRDNVIALYQGEVAQQAPAENETTTTPATGNIEDEQVTTPGTNAAPAPATPAPAADEPAAAPTAPAEADDAPAEVPTIKQGEQAPEAEETPATAEANEPAAASTAPAEADAPDEHPTIQQGTPAPAADEPTAAPTAPAEADAPEATPTPTAAPAPTTPAPASPAVATPTEDESESELDVEATPANAGTPATNNNNTQPAPVAAQTNVSADGTAADGSFIVLSGAATPTTGAAIIATGLTQGERRFGAEANPSAEPPVEAGPSLETLNTAGDFANYLTNGDPATAAGDLTQPLSENPQAMRRLTDMLVSLDGDTNITAQNAAAIVAEMANSGMTIENVVDLLDGGATGAADNTSVSYGGATGTAGDGIITAEEALFGIRAFVNETNQNNGNADDLVPPTTQPADAVYADPNNPDSDVTVTFDEAVVPRNTAEQHNYDQLEALFDTDGPIAVDDVANYLQAAEDSGSEHMQKRAISSLLEMIGITSEDGNPLQPNDAAIVNLYNSYKAGGNSLTDMAQDLAHTGRDDRGYPSDGSSITRESAMANLRQMFMDQESPDTDADMAFTSSVTNEAGEQIAMPNIETWESFLSFIDDGDVTTTPSLNAGDTLYGQSPDVTNRLEAFLSTTAGISEDDATAIVEQMVQDNMTIGQIYTMLDGGRIGGAREGNADEQSGSTGMDMYYGGSEEATVSDDRVVELGEARWALADYVESRKKSDDAVESLAAVEIEVPDAAASAGDSTFTGGVDMQQNDRFAPGQGQEVMNPAMATAYKALFGTTTNNDTTTTTGEVDPAQLTTANLRAIFDAAGNSDAQKRTAVTVILDAFGLETETGMPLDIHDPLVDHLIGEADPIDFGAFMARLVHGDAQSNTAIPEPIDAAQVKHNIYMEMATNTDFPPAAQSGTLSDGTTTELDTTSPDVAFYMDPDNVDALQSAASWADGTATQSADAFYDLFGDSIDPHTEFTAEHADTLKAFLVGFTALPPEQIDPMIQELANAEPPLDFKSVQSYLDGGASSMDGGTEVTYNMGNGETATETVGDGTFTREGILFALQAASSSDEAIAGAPTGASGTSDGANVTGHAGNTVAQLLSPSANIDSSISGIDTASDPEAAFINVIMKNDPAAGANTPDTAINELNIHEENRLMQIMAAVADITNAEARQIIEGMLTVSPPPTLSEVFAMLEGEDYAAGEFSEDGTGLATDAPQSALDSISAYLTANNADATIVPAAPTTGQTSTPAPAGQGGTGTGTA